MVSPWRGGQTKDQLHAEARHKGIKGRSNMTKADLERAVSRRLAVGRWPLAVSNLSPMTDVEVFVDPGCPVGLGHFALGARGRARSGPYGLLAFLLPGDPGRLRRGSNRPRGVPATGPRGSCVLPPDAAGLRGGTRRSRRGCRGPALFRMGPAVLRLEAPEDEQLLADCVAAAGLEARLLEAADDESWDVPIRQAMEVAYAFGGPKTQTPAIVVRSDPPHGSRDP